MKIKKVIPAVALLAALTSCQETSSVTPPSSSSDSSISTSLPDSSSTPDSSSSSSDPLTLVDTYEELQPILSATLEQEYTEMTYFNDDWSERTVSVTRGADQVYVINEYADSTSAIYSGIIDNVQYSVNLEDDVATSASRMNIVDEVNDYGTEMTLEDAEEYVASLTPTLDSLGVFDLLADENFVVSTYLPTYADSTYNISIIGYSENSKSSRYYHDTLILTLDDSLTLLTANLTRNSTTIADEWDFENHTTVDISDAVHTNVSEITFGTPTNTDPLIDFSGYYITSFEANVFALDPNTGTVGTEANVIPVGSYVESIEVASYLPATAIEHAILSVTASSDTSVIAPDEGGYGFVAVAAGTTELTVTNGFVESTVEVEVIEPSQSEGSPLSIYMIGEYSDLLSEIEFTVQAGSSETYSCMNISAGPFDLSSANIYVMNEGVATVEISDSDPSDMYVELTITGNSVGGTAFLMNTYFGQGTFYINVTE